MSLVINTNVASLDVQKNLATTQTNLSKSLQQLSSGLRINSAADDAAGLAISQSFQAQISSMAQAEQNANDGISLAQVGDGALSQMGTLLQNMRSLAVEASNGTLSDSARTDLNNEFTADRTEMDRISAVTNFNGQNLLDGTLNTTLQVGINDSANDQITLAVASCASTAIGKSAVKGSGSQQFLSAAALDSQADAQTALATIDQSISQIADARAGLGAVENRLQSTVSNLQSASENFSSALSRVQDADIASTTSEMTRNQILSQAGVAVLAQANQLPAEALSLITGK